MIKRVMIASAAALVLSGCGSPPRAARVLDPELERSASAARSAYNASAPKEASAHYRKALQRARLADQPEAIARMAYNLAACRAQEGQYADAQSALNEAVFESNRCKLDFPEMNLLQAEIYRGQGKITEAVAVLDEREADARKRKNSQVAAQRALLRAELECDRKAGKAALAELAKVDQNMIASGSAVFRARVSMARARALALDSRPADAIAAFDLAAAAFREARLYSDMAIAIANGAEACERAGDIAGAVDRYYRAARSFGAAGDEARSLALSGKAAVLAEGMDNKSMLEAIARLGRDDAALPPVPVQNAPAE